MFWSKKDISRTDDSKRLENLQDACQKIADEVRLADLKTKFTTAKLKLKNAESFKGESAKNLYDNIIKELQKFKNNINQPSDTQLSYDANVVLKLINQRVEFTGKEDVLVVTEEKKDNLVVKKEEDLKKLSELASKYTEVISSINEQKRLGKKVIEEMEAKFSAEEDDDIASMYDNEISKKEDEIAILNRDESYSSLKVRSLSKIITHLKSLLTNYKNIKSPKAIEELEYIDFETIRKVWDKSVGIGAYMDKLNSLSDGYYKEETELAKKLDETKSSPTQTQRSVEQRRENLRIKRELNKEKSETVESVEKTENKESY